MRSGRRKRGGANRWVLEVLFDANSCELRDRLRAQNFRTNFLVGFEGFLPRISPPAATTSTAALLVEAQGWGRVKNVGM